MKRSDFVRLMGNIDEKYLKEADSYSARPRNWVKVTAVAACIAVLVTAIPLALILNRENGNTEDLPAITTKDNTVIDKPEPDKEEPLVIFCSSPTELKQQLKADANVEIKDVAERKDFISSVDDTIVEKKDGTPYVKTITIGNETFEISYEESRASETYQSLSTHLKAYASIDRYSIDEYTNGFHWGKLRFEFSQETGKLTQYFKGTGFMKLGTLGEKELHKLALEEINNLYDIDIAKDPNYRYECRHHPANSIYHPEDEYYHIIYRRYINGYATDEYVSITLDTSGQIISISQNLGLYNEVADIISKEKINTEKEKFKEQISDKHTIGEMEKPLISMDNYGKCSIRFVALISVNDIAHYYDMCVEIT